MRDARVEINSLQADIMNFAPLFEAPLAVQIHVATVIPAALIGPYLFWARKGTPIHRLAGRVWLGLMAITALSSFFIHQINVFMGFSPIHLLSAYVLSGVFLAYRAARQRRIASHRRQVIGLYLGGIVGAGAFTFLPGRIMNQLAFGVPDEISSNHVLVFAGLLVGITVSMFAVSRLMTPHRT